MDLIIAKGRNMERHLNLIKTGHQSVEKRVFPRFPFSYLVFRQEGGAQSYEVKDISYSGMSLGLKDGVLKLKIDETIKGEIHWHGTRISVEMRVRRLEEKSVGVEFLGGRDTETKMKNFLSVANIARSMKPIHEYKEQIDMPSNLSHWLRTDGPFEVFVWKHVDNEISKIQIIMMNNFIEWNDGKGLSSGKIISIKNTDTPLMNEEEFEFLIDEKLDEDKLEFSKEIVREINSELLSSHAFEFLCRKLSIQ